jgi:hypothetical protein
MELAELLNGKQIPQEKQAAVTSPILMKKWSGSV